MADPRAMSGQQTYPPTTCECGDQGGIHIGGKGKCQRPDCPCAEFRPVAKESWCPHCGAWWSPQEARRAAGG